MKSAGGSENCKNKIGSLLMIMSYNNLYKSHTITKQQFEQALAAKQEAESQVRILQQQEKQVLIKICCAKQNPKLR
jgi:membrane fusion protein (multidrug efflux system)